MLTIDLASSIPITDQLVQGIRAAIARGDVSQGDELPAVRQLAGDLGIHWNTVARAYKALEASGLVQSQRGRGTRVTSDQATEEGAAEYQPRLAGALADAKLQGANRRAVERVIKKQLDALWRGGKPQGA